MKNFNKKLTVLTLIILCALPNKAQANPTPAMALIGVSTIFGAAQLLRHKLGMLTPAPALAPIDMEYQTPDLDGEGRILFDDFGKPIPPQEYTLETLTSKYWLKFAAFNKYNAQNVRMALILYPKIFNFSDDELKQLKALPHK